MRGVVTVTERFRFRGSPSSVPLDLRRIRWRIERVLSRRSDLALACGSYSPCSPPRDGGRVGIGREEEGWRISWPPGTTGESWRSSAGPRTGPRPFVSWTTFWPSPAPSKISGNHASPGPRLCRFQFAS